MGCTRATLCNEYILLLVMNPLLKNDYNYSAKQIRDGPKNQVPKGLAYPDPNCINVRTMLYKSLITYLHWLFNMIFSV